MDALDVLVAEGMEGGLEDGGDLDGEGVFAGCSGCGSGVDVEIVLDEEVEMRVSEED